MVGANSGRRKPRRRDMSYSALEWCARVGQNVRAAAFEQPIDMKPGALFAASLVPAPSATAAGTEDAVACRGRRFQVGLAQRPDDAGGASCVSGCGVAAGALLRRCGAGGLLLWTARHGRSPLGPVAFVCRPGRATGSCSAPRPTGRCSPAGNGEPTATSVPAGWPSTAAAAWSPWGARRGRDGAVR